MHLGNRKISLLLMPFAADSVISNGSSGFLCITLLSDSKTE